MKSSKLPFATPLARGIMAAFFLGGLLPAVYAEQPIPSHQATKPGQHIALWDPPPAFIRGEHRRAGQASLDDQECPSFLFRNSFEAGWLDGIFRTGFEPLPESASAPIRYTTVAGFVVQVNKHTITIQGPWGMNSVQHWGDPHENLNGKHVKDWGGMAGWDGARRTILIDGGAKVTMEAAGPTGMVLLTSIYDGQQNLQIENTTNIIVHHGTEAADTATREAAQYDGETARFTVDSATGIALYGNIYNEDATFTRVPYDVPIGWTGGCANPGQVNDTFP